MTASRHKLAGTFAGARSLLLPDADKKELAMADTREATLYRMVLPAHTCPFGVRAKEMLEGAGFTIDEHLLTSREDVDAFKAEHGVTTTPQIFIDGERIGGSDALEDYLAKVD